MTEQERINFCLDYVANILEYRATDKSRDASARMAYNSALTMLLYAMQGQSEIISQFDERGE